MSIYVNTGNEFSKIKNIYKHTEDGFKRISRVYVHDGTKYVLVKGRIYEIEWELDMSEWGGTKWNSKYSPLENQSLSMYTLANGDLFNVVHEVVNNNSTNQYSTNRYALQRISKDTAKISKFGTTSWSKWDAVSGYKQTDHPIGVIKCNDYFVAYSDHGIFYVFNLDGKYLSKYENETWHTDGSAKWICEYLHYGIHVDYVAHNDTSGSIYYTYVDQNKENSTSTEYKISCYRVGINKGSLKTPISYYSGKTESKYNGLSCSLIAGKKIVMYFDGNSAQSVDSELVVFNGATKYNADDSVNTYNTNTYAFCSLLFSSDGDFGRSGEHPCFMDDNYVYTISDSGSPKTIRKRRLDNLEMVWKLDVPRFYHDNENDNIHQPCPSVDGGFLLPNGVIIYPNGTYDKLSQALYSDVSKDIEVISYCFDENLGFGYLNIYNSDESSSKENINGYAVNKIIKFKEIRK